MNAAHILNIFRRKTVLHIKPPLGRWNIHNHKETILKIKYANEDNCGISGNNNTTHENTDDYKYIHMMGYESVHD